MRTACALTVVLVLGCLGVGGAVLGGGAAQWWEVLSRGRCNLQDRTTSPQDRTTSPDHVTYPIMHLMSHFLPPQMSQNDKRLWKHNLRSLRYAGGKKDARRRRSHRFHISFPLCRSAGSATADTTPHYTILLIMLDLDKGHNPYFLGFQIKNVICFKKLK